MPITIDKKIEKIELVTEENIKTKTEPTVTNKVKIRPHELLGTTYKLKSPLSEHALYITINHLEENGKKYPFEIFINSKSLEHQQWIITITRLISSILRQHCSYGIDISFIVSELRSVFDPNGGYLLKHRRIPSLVAEIGDILEEHLIKLGTLENNKIEPPIVSTKSNYSQCPACDSISMTMMDGCLTCTVCGFSKCG